MTKIICDLRRIDFENGDELADSGYIQSIESELLNRVGKLVIVEIRTKRIRSLPDKSEVKK
jgi:hypothetical protein